MSTQARILTENRQPYSEQSEFGHFLSCFSLNRTTIRLKTSQKLAQISLLSLRALFSDHIRLLGICETVTLG